MEIAKGFLSVLLHSSNPSLPLPHPDLPPFSLTTALVDKPPPVPAIRAFDEQVAIGSKDGLLRSAAETFKRTAADIERSQVRSEDYWRNALKIRRSNWALCAAPLPAGTLHAKGADTTSKDFLISYGLEDCKLLYY